MNELANLADQLGADIEAVRRGIGSDPRIGYDFLYAGAGYGGSCFPKDVRALMRTATDNRRSLRILEAVEAVNDDQKKALLGHSTDRLRVALVRRPFAPLGLALQADHHGQRRAPRPELRHAL